MQNVENAKFKMQSAKYKDSRFKIQDSRFKIKFLHFALCILRFAFTNVLRFELEFNPFGRFFRAGKRDFGFAFEKRRAELQGGFSHQAGEMRLVRAL